MSECPVVAWLRRKNMEQKKLAERIGAPEPAMSAFIAGRRGLRVDRLIKLSEVTGISLKRLNSWTAAHRAVA